MPLMDGNAVFRFLTPGCLERADWGKSYQETFGRVRWFAFMVLLAFICLTCVFP